MYCGVRIRVEPDARDGCGDPLRVPWSPALRRRSNSPSSICLRTASGAGFGARACFSRLASAIPGCAGRPGGLAGPTGLRPS